MPSSSAHQWREAHLRYGALLVLGLTVQLAATAASADRASDLADQASSAQRQTCQNVTSLSACHPAYPTGCSHSTNPQYDGYLNLLKNQTPPPSSGISRYITQTSIQSLDANTPAGCHWPWLPAACGQSSSKCSCIWAFANGSPRWSPAKTSRAKSPRLTFSSKPPAASGSHRGFVAPMKIPIWDCKRSLPPACTQWTSANWSGSGLPGAVRPAVALALKARRVARRNGTSPPATPP